MKFKTDKLFLIISIIIGIVFGIVAEKVIYNLDVFELFDSFVLKITIYLFAFALVMGIALLIKGLQNSTFVNFGKVMALTLAALIAFTGLTALFEFIYELDIKPLSKGASDLQYVFIVDDSGSMDQNDPYDERYNAIETIIRGLKPTRDFAVYSFANDTVCLTAMGSTDSQNYTYVPAQANLGAQTYIIGAINKAIDDVAKSGVQTKVIVLTDGAPSDSGWGKSDRLISRCNSENVTISSVGFGQPYEEFLRELANGTGGTYVISNNLANLGMDLENIVKTQTTSAGRNRDLLGARSDSKATSVLYALMRIVFLALLGAAWTIFKMLLVGERKYTKKAMVISIILCAVAAILMELLTLIGFGMFVRILFCALWACTIIPTQNIEKIDLGQDLYSGVNGMGNSGVGKELNSNSQWEVGESKSFL